MHTDGLVFGESEARLYESWFKTEEGRRADRLEKALLKDLSARFDGSGTMLDVGAGTGHFTRWFQELGWNVIGVDISMPMLNEARRRDPHFRCVVADGALLPFPETSFDVVATITTLEFVSQPVRVLREMMRVSKKGLLLGVLNRWSLLAAQRRVQGWFRHSPYSHAKFLSTGQLERMVREAAGPTHVLELETKTTLWPQWSGMTVSTLPWGGFLGMAVEFQR